MKGQLDGRTLPIALWKRFSNRFQVMAAHNEHQFLGHQFIEGFWDQLKVDQLPSGLRCIIVSRWKQDARMISIKWCCYLHFGTLKVIFQVPGRSTGCHSLFPPWICCLLSLHGWLRPEVFDANVGVQLSGGKMFGGNRMWWDVVSDMMLINIKLSVKCMLKS